MIGILLTETPHNKLPEPGSYWCLNGNWYAVTPNGHHGNLSNHEVTEHSDGTITVSPSILVHDGDKELWHGFLRKGIWSEA